MLTKLTWNLHVHKNRITTYGKQIQYNWQCLALAKERSLKKEQELSEKIQKRLQEN